MSDIPLKFLALLRDEQGRDKFNKLVQFFSRYMSFKLLTADPKSPLGAQFKALFELIRDGRKMAFMFKAGEEWLKIQPLLKAKMEGQQILKLCGLAGMMVYWTYDNLDWLSKTKLIEKNPNYLYWSSLGWCIGNGANLILDTIQLKDNLKKEEKLMSVNTSQAETELANLRKARTAILLRYPKNLGDLTVAAHNCGFPQKLLGKTLDDGTIGLAGMVAALAVLYDIWSRLPAMPQK